jgi:hypothetical protein
MCKCQMYIFNTTCATAGVNMVLFMCVMAAMVPLTGVGLAVAEVWRASRAAKLAHEKVHVLEMVRRIAQVAEST